VNFAACSCIDLLLVASTCRFISGDDFTWDSFCACEYHGARRWFQQALPGRTLKWTRLLCRSLCGSLNLRSGFLQIGLLLKRLLWLFLSCANCLWMQGMARGDSWIYVFKLRQFVRHDYPYYYDKFDDRILRIPGAKFCHSVAHVYLQTLNLASFTVKIATRFLSLISKIIEMKSHVVI